MEHEGGTFQLSTHSNGSGGPVDDEMEIAGEEFKEHVRSFTAVAEDFKDFVKEFAKLLGHVDQDTPSGK